VTYLRQFAAICRLVSSQAQCWPPCSCLIAVFRCSCVVLQSTQGRPGRVPTQALATHQQQPAAALPTLPTLPPLTPHLEHQQQQS
jgi:hypothetical protein